MKRCMIVDDSSVIRTVAKRILATSESLVIEAASGREALDLCAQDMPDVILVSSKLPDMNVVDFIRAAANDRNKPRIILSLTEMDVGAIMRAKRAGAQGYVLKPFSRTQLLQRFSQSFAKARLAAVASTAA